MTKKCLVAIVSTILVGSLAGCASGPSESPDDYPSDEIRLTITYAPGGPTDTAGRAIATFMENELGQPVVPENVAGASGSAGTAKVATSEPDGYSIAMTTESAVSRVPIIDDVGYTMDDLQPIGVATITPAAITVAADSEYKTAEQFFAAAKANPGTISIGHGGANTPQAVSLLRLQEEGLEFRQVPFEGEAPSSTALLGGNVDAIMSSLGPNVYPRVQSGEFRVLALGADEAKAFVPDAPTLAELGYDGGEYSTSSYILAVPADTPQDIVDTLESTLKAALQDADVRQKIGEVYLPPEFIGADELAERMQKDSEELRPILEQIGE